jgi:hypothetical protein
MVSISKTSPKMGKGKGIWDHIFYRHFDFRPQIVYRRITKEEHMTAALEARELNKSRKEKVHVDEGFQDIWTFNRLPYADLPLPGTHA